MSLEHYVRSDYTEYITKEQLRIVFDFFQTQQPSKVFVATTPGQALQHEMNAYEELRTQCPFPIETLFIENDVRVYKALTGRDLRAFAKAVNPTPLSNAIKYGDFLTMLESPELQKRDYDGLWLDLDGTKAWFSWFRENNHQLARVLTYYRQHVKHLVFSFTASIRGPYAKGYKLEDYNEIIPTDLQELGFQTELIWNSVNHPHPRGTVFTARGARLWRGLIRIF